MGIAGKIPDFGPGDVGGGPPELWPELPCDNYFSPSATTRTPHLSAAG
jgi:hypothetical protein